MNETQSSYRQIFKATSLFGGVQVFNIILSVFRSKIIAVLLGPAGMGIVGLLTATTSLVASLTNFGLGTSAVRDIAEANESGNEERVSHIVTIFRRIVWITGLLGLLLTLVLAPWLSLLTFGNKNYTVGFLWLSLTLLFNQLTSGQDVLLQGMRKLRYLAKASVVGSFAGLLLSVPLYYFFAIDGIVPALVVTSLVTLGVTWYFSLNIKVNTIQVTQREIIIEGKEMLRIGFMLSLSSLITLGVSYAVRIYIGKTGGIADVGLYNAGFAIITTYVGLVFSAMATDYYPRLSGVASDNKKASTLINHQAEIAILILAPVLCIFLVFINWVVILLYSSKFLSVNGMIHWAALGMYFKAASWSIAFVFLAKGDTKTFFWSEFLSNIYLFLLNIFGYKLFGLNGMGISFLICYIIYLFQVYIIASKKYEFYFHKDFYRIFVIQLALGLMCFFISKFLPKPWTYLVGSVIILISSYFSFIEIDKRLDLGSILSKFRKKT